MLRATPSFLVALLVLACGVGVTRAADYPTRPITLVVAFTPGGASDVLARILGRKLEQILRQPLVIDNRPGAGGNVAAEAVARAADYPARPITLVVAFTPGGASDVLARILGRKLEQILGQPLVIDNLRGPAATSQPRPSPTRRPTATRCSMATTPSLPPTRRSTRRSISTRKRILPRSA